MGTIRKVVALLIAASLSLTCAGSLGSSGIQDQSSAEATLRSFYTALEAKNLDGVVNLFRAKTGAALSASEDSAIQEGLRRVFAADPIHISAIQVTGSRALEPDAIRLLPSRVSAIRLTFSVTGSANTCLPLPISNGTGPFAELQGKWYMLEDVQFGLPFTVLRC
jgi:hypothetical protein